MRYSIFLALIAALSLSAQTPAIPNARGVYVRSPNGFLSLNSNFLMPMSDGVVKWLLGFGNGGLVAEIPGPHSTVQTANTRPQLYARGFPASSGLYLVREIERQDYRALKMHRNGDIHQLAQFRNKDLVPIDIKPLVDGVLEITPLGALPPGEYLLISALEPIYENIKIAFDFGVEQPR